MSPNKCVIFLFDGARFDVFDGLLKSGRLPNIKKYILENGTFLKGYSCLPTTTGPSHLPFIYGIYPGTANVPGIRWLDKGKLKNNIMSNSDMRSYVGLGSLFMGRDVDQKYIPLYDYFSRPVNIFSFLDKEHHVPLKTNRLMRLAYIPFAHFTGKWGVIDYASAKLAKNSIRRGSDFILSVFPALDEITHLSYPTHENVLRQYHNLDELVGELFKALSHDDIRKMMFFIVSDHGHTRTHTHISPVEIAKEEGFNPIYYPKVLRKNCDLAIMESGNAMASLYFMDPVRDRPAFYEEFNKDKKNSRLINRILLDDGIDFVAYRVNDLSIGVKNRNGEIILEFMKNDYIKLKNIGDNPLQFKVDRDIIHLNESLNFTKNTNYPDSIVQLRQLFCSNRTGDLVLFAKEGFDLRKRHEWPEHRSSHGSLSKLHMEVPICTNIKLTSTCCRTVDIFPTILAQFGHNIPENINGKIIS